MCVNLCIISHVCLHELVFACTCAFEHVCIHVHACSYTCSGTISCTYLGISVFTLEWSVHMLMLAVRAVMHHVSECNFVRLLLSPNNRNVLASVL